MEINLSVALNENRWRRGTGGPAVTAWLTLLWALAEKWTRLPLDHMDLNSNPGLFLCITTVNTSMFASALEPFNRRREHYETIFSLKSECVKVKTPNVSGAANSHVFSPTICPLHMPSIRHVSGCLLLQFWAHTRHSCEAGKHLMHACILDFLAVVVMWHICSVFFFSTRL